MRVFMGTATVLLAAAIAGAPVAAGTPDTRLEGTWEAVVASPRRPVIFELRFERTGEAWSGRFHMRGLPEFALDEIRAESGAVHFRFPPELDTLTFDGSFSNGEIVGTVPYDGPRTPMRLTRVTPLPSPANRLEAWRQDLDFAVRRLALDRSFSPGARQAMEDTLAALRRRLEHASDAQIVVSLARAVALADNAHTWLRLEPTRDGLLSRHFPIGLWWFEDGLFVVRAAPAYERTLRCRVVAIEGHSIGAVRDRVRGLIAGNDAWASYVSPGYLSKPDVLHGLGLIRDPGAATFTFEDTAGRRFDVRIGAEAVHRDAMADETWQELSPLTETGRPPWSVALAPLGGSLPLYLRSPGRPYWFEYQPESALLYFQFNRSADAREGPPFQAFGDSLLAFAAMHPVEALVVDLRLNSGGNLHVAKEFMARLAAVERFRETGRLFVITGPCTFSAGLFHAAQLRQLARATFVGEPPGDRLDFWAEGGRIVLPNSQVVIAYSNGFHGYSGTNYPEWRPYYEELSVGNLAPDVPAPLISSDYFAGRDPALEAIHGMRAKERPVGSR